MRADTDGQINSESEDIKKSTKTNNNVKDRNFHSISSPEDIDDLLALVEEDPLLHQEELEQITADLTTQQSTAITHISEKESIITEERNAAVNSSTDLFSITGNEPVSPSQNSLGVANNLMIGSFQVPPVIFVNNFYCPSFFHSGFVSQNPSNFFSNVVTPPQNENVEKKRSTNELPNPLKKRKVAKKRHYARKANEYGLTIRFFKDAEESCKKEYPNWSTLSREARKSLIILKAEKINREINEEHNKRVVAVNSITKT